MDFAERLAKERRARLAAERLLEQKSRELFTANEKLSRHARALSDQIVEQRQAVRSALSEAEILKDAQSRYAEDLDKAHSHAVMAERRLWDSINTITDGFAVFDASLCLVAANRAYLSIMDDPDLAPGMAYLDLLTSARARGRIRGETGDLPADWAQGVIARLEVDQAEPIVLCMPDGRWLRLQDRRARDGDVVSLLQDITEEKRIWAAIEAIPDGFVLYDREDRLILSNQRYREVYPLCADAMLPGATYEEILRHGIAQGEVPEAIGQEEDWIAARLDERRTSFQSTTDHLSDGRTIRAKDTPTPDGGRVGLRIDISEEVAQKKALEDARLAAESANRAKSAFLANMSHEIRTPMNGVVGMAELLCETALSEEQRLFAETIRSSGEALLVIINDILDYSKLEAERMVLHPEPFDLERTIHEVMILLQPSAREKGIDLLIDFDVFLPTMFVGDVGRVRQILTNLIGNAVKFTEKGHVLTRVVGFEDGTGGHHLHVTVEDTGIGIAEEHCEHIFGEFNQVESQSNRKFDGTGLGLAITQRLVQRMGGEIWVDSVLGEGSAFGFRLTLPDAEAGESPELPAGLRQVLVLDSQMINRAIIERQLQALGIEATLCRAEDEALAAIAKSPFDLIIADHDGVQGTGVGLARQLVAAGHQGPIFLISTNPAGVQLPPDLPQIAAIVQKPVFRAELYRRLRALAPAPIAPPEEPPEPDIPLAQRRKMRVLAAEDNRTNQLVFQKMVREIEIELLFANNGLEAVAHFQSFKPDMIFMDISMPEMDGRDAARAIRALEAEGKGHLRHIPIVALTAHAMDGDAEGILAAGIDKYMTKPLRKGPILETISGLCPRDAKPIQFDPELLTGT